MSESPFVLEDQTESEPRKFCPLLQSDCRGEECQWWVADYMEDKNRMRLDCAVAMIAKALTDEALLKLSGR